jgi:predicted phosphoadenosine phosphosulfate sulfurtransferase
MAMPMPKTYTDKDVSTATTERLNFVFAEFEKVYVSFSGGEDSGVLLNLAIEAVRRAGKLPLDVLLVDLEGQYKHTIDFVMRMLSRPEVRAHWLCLPIHLRNAVSQFQPHWLCWDPDKKDVWVRPLPEHPGVINDEKYFPYFERGMEFEESVPLLADWISGGKKTCCLVGIRFDESLLGADRLDLKWGVDGAGLCNRLKAFQRNRPGFRICRRGKAEFPVGVPFYATPRTDEEGQHHN